LLCNQQENPMQHPTIDRLITFFETHADVFDPATGDCLKKPARTSGRKQHVSATLPHIGEVRNGTSYAAWKVWSGSSTKKGPFVPLAKEPQLARKAATRIYRKAMNWNASGKLAGTHGGVIGSHVLLVLHSLIFDFLNHATGRLDPSYEGIQRRTRLCRQTVAKALARLKELGIINWRKRCVPDYQDRGFIMRQITNEYAILPPTQWRGYTDPDAAPPPDPSAWGACPPLPSLIEQACADIRGGDSPKTAISALDADPSDKLALQLASLGRALGV
jgi:hypothetical protein